MVNAIIFDFGDVFINKNKEAKDKALAALGLKEWTEELENLEARQLVAIRNEDRRHFSVDPLCEHALHAVNHLAGE